MADVSKIQLPDGTVVNVKDARITGVDPTPTSNSDHVVTSGGVAEALSDMESDVQDATSIVNNLSSIVSNLSSQVSGLSAAEYVTAWDGSSTPVVADIPAGVEVTYGGDTYTGTKTADATTANKIYMVSDGETDKMFRYISSYDGSTYSWVSIGSTDIDLSDYVRKDSEVWMTEDEFNDLTWKDPEVTYNIYEEQGSL